MSFPLNEAVKLDPSQVYDKCLGELDGYKIYSVYGTYIMITADMEFVVAGNGYAKKYIPKDEIWLDRYVPESEQLYVVAHEITEADIMKATGMKYEDAHQIANQAEYNLRCETYIPLEKAPTAIADLLKNQGSSKNDPDDKFDPIELEIGVEVEHEHTDDDEGAKEIAKDHLVEFPYYYTENLPIGVKDARETAEKIVKKYGYESLRAYQHERT